MKYPVQKSFTERVYDVVAAIPKGKTMTYAEVARRAGSPRAARAVGNIMHNNPDTQRVPCHRVVRSDGSVGGYARGTKKKIEILKKEGAIHP
ncbi:MAG TPA: MGMT family protein [Candidatus Paceibacterota bacterium]|nr:MGMT family protein [Candidatus Paceibacterota bacterium]